MAHKRLAQLTNVLDPKDSRKFFVGIDVHKKSYHVAFYTKGCRAHTFVAPADPKHMVNTIQKAKIHIAQIAYEAGPTGFDLARTLLEAGLPAIVVAPSKVARPVTRDNKTDRLDCIKLAKYAARGMLKSIAIPSKHQEAQRCLIRRRHDLVDAIRRVKQRIRSHLLFSSAQQGHTWSKKGIQSLHKAALRHPGRPA